jgi:hypothetical protein
MDFPVLGNMHATASSVAGSRAATLLSVEVSVSGELLVRESCAYV